jgi:hypothetical protein
MPSTSLVAHLAPLATRCSRGAKSPKPTSAGWPANKLYGTPGASPSQLHLGVEVGRLPYVAASAPGPPNDQERETPHASGTRPGLLHIWLCPIPDP